MERALAEVGRAQRWRRGAFLPGRGARRYPLVNVYDDGTNFYVDALAPGVEPGTLEVKAAGSRLSIAGEKPAIADAAEVCCHRSEREAGRFVRTVELPAELDPAGVGVEYRDGILRITCRAAARRSLSASPSVNHREWMTWPTKVPVARLAVQWGGTVGGGAVARRRRPWAGRPERMLRKGTRAAELYVAPQVDIYEDEHGLVVVADLPGVPPKALEVPVEAGVLTIQGRAAHEPPGHPLHEEYKLEGFFREFRLSEAVDAEAIVAESRHGVLTLHPPQKAETTRKIEVRTSES